MSATTTPPSTAKHEAMHDHPIGAIALGLLFLFFALWGISFQVTTSEAWYMGLSASSMSLAPHFSVFGQLIDLFNGNITGLYAQAVTYAWGVEIVQFFFATGIVFSALKHNRIAGWICIIGCLVLMILDTIADYKFGSAANDWQHAGFSAVVFMMAFGLTFYALDLIIRKGIIAGIRRLGWIK